jgi:hypothetical protein
MHDVFLDAPRRRCPWSTIVAFKAERACQRAACTISEHFQPQLCDQGQLPQPPSVPGVPTTARLSSRQRHRGNPEEYKTQVISSMPVMVKFLKQGTTLFMYSE